MDSSSLKLIYIRLYRHMAEKLGTPYLQVTLNQVMTVVNRFGVLIDLCYIGCSN